MSYDLAVGDIIECRFNYRQFEQRLLNVFHFKVSTGTTGLQAELALQEMIDALETDAAFWPQTWAADAASSCLLREIVLQVIFPTRRIYQSKVVAIPGTGSGTGLPSNVSLSLTKVGTVSGRGKTGRVEVPGIVPGLVSGGTVSSGGLTWLTGLGTVMLNTLSAPTYSAEANPVILNRFAPAGSQQITAVRPQLTVRVDRRRTVGVGE